MGDEIQNFLHNTSVYRSNHYIHSCYISKDYKECLRSIEEQLHKTHGQSEYPLYIKGLILRERGRIEDSLTIFQAALCLNPTNIFNLRQVGQTLFLMGKHRDALAVFEEALALESEDRSIWHSKGLCYKFLKEYDDAIDSFRTANSILQNEKSFIELGEIYELQGETQEALDVYLEGMSVFPECTELLTKVGLLYITLNDAGQAVLHLGNALAYDPKYANAILATGSIMQSNGDYDVALIKYRVAVTQTPNSAQLWNNIGMCFFGKSKLIAAAACLKRAIYLSPFLPEINYNLGVVLMQSGQFASAFHYFSAAINLQKVPNPNPTKEECRAYSYLALSLSKLDDYENSCSAYEKALSMNKTDVITYINYIISLYKNEDYHKAKELFIEVNKMIQQDPQLLKEDEDIPEQHKLLASVLNL